VGVSTGTSTGSSVGGGPGVTEGAVVKALVKNSSDGILVELSPFTGGTKPVS
jgi:hypothetical protein